MNRVAIIILNWNGYRDTIECLESVANLTYKHFEVVLVDNGSVDDSIEKIEAYIALSATKIILLKNRKNKGFAGGVNTGIRYALDHKFAHVALLNNDAVVDKKWLEELVSDMADDTTGIVTGLLASRNGKRIDSTGEFYSIWGLSFPRNRGDKIDQAPKAGRVFGATGGASLYRTDVFREIGLFDETFFAYYEDVDISFRSQLAGWRISYTPKAIAYHNHGTTSKKIPGFQVYQLFKNLPMVFVKNVPAKLLFPIGMRFYLAYWLMLGNAIASETGIAALKGLLANFIFGFGALAKRRHTQQTTRVSIGFIKRILYPDLPPDQTGMRKFRHFFLRNKPL